MTVEVKYIVTDNNINYSPDWVKVRSLNDLIETKKTIARLDILVINKFPENSIEVATILPEIFKDFRTCRLYYINNNLDDGIRAMVLGYDGKVYNDEFYLESKAVLNNLVKSGGALETVDQSGEIEIAKEFIDSCGKGTAMSPRYLADVASAMQVLLNDAEEKSKDLITTAASANKLIESVNKNTGEMTKQIAELNNKIEKIKRNRSPIISTVDNSKIKKSYVNSVATYAGVRYNQDISLIRIKEVGSCPYLVSFLMGFRIYLERIRNVSPVKLVIIEPVGGQPIGIYKNVPDSGYITIENKNDLSEYQHKILFINCPSQDVIKKALSDIENGVAIVLDRTAILGHIITKIRRNQRVRYAVTSEKAIKNLKLNKLDCFTMNNSISGTLFNVKRYDDYPVSKDQRENKYITECQEFYDKLYLR